MWLVIQEINKSNWKLNKNNDRNKSNILKAK